MAMSQYGTQTALVGKMVFLALSQGDHDLLVVYLSLWKMMEFVNGKDYPIYYEK